MHGRSSFDGVYMRMESEDATRAFRNGMNLTLSGNVATLRIPGYERFVATQLDMTRTSCHTFILDWRRRKAAWESSQFEATILNGVVGLLERGIFWRRQN